MSHNITMKELPISEQPYEKCEEYGVEALSDTELLAVILRSGTKEKRVTDLALHILSCHPVHQGIRGINYLSKAELMKVKGIGSVKATQILCIAELSKRMAKTVTKENISFHSPSSIAEYFMASTRYLRREQMMLLLFDTKNNLIKEMILSTGTVNASLASPRELFIEALRYEAVNIILLHNHPSGDPTPSAQDIMITKRIKDAGELIGIQLLDHIVLGDNLYVSFKEKGIF